jgi:hypothetical protein
MSNIAESNVLLRAETQLPAGFKIATDEYRDGWSRMRSGGAGRLEKKMKARGWSFLPTPRTTLRSGVGKTAQDAIGSALCQALGELELESNAVEVGHMEVAKYPWFFVARVRVQPYRIQCGPLNESAMPPNAPALYPHYSSAMPVMRTMMRS